MKQQAVFKSSRYPGWMQGSVGNAPKPSRATQEAVGTTPKPSQVAQEGVGTTPKPSQVAQEGFGITPKPSQVTQEGFGITPKPSQVTQEGFRDVHQCFTPVLKDRIATNFSFTHHKINDYETSTNYCLSGNHIML